MTTPVPTAVALDTIPLSPELADLIARYEPRTVSHGLYAHQAKVLSAISSGVEDLVLTTATGSGKSLCFWAWAANQLVLSEDATALATFPTQALLWGQADRLRRLSDPNSIVERSGQTFAGTLRLGSVAIPWSVWYGVSNCDDMRAQQDSESFEAARIRVCTMDKAHWDLMKEGNRHFLSRLRAVIIDEAHYWHGLNGAQLRRMLDRMQLSIQLLGGKPPSFFLSSATLSGVPAFAAAVTGVDRPFTWIDDAGAPKFDVVDATAVPTMIRSAPQLAGLHRFALLAGPGEEPIAGRALLEDTFLGNANALCFVQSKLVGRLLCKDLNDNRSAREAIAYDADLPAKERRKLEHLFHVESKAGRTYIATSALELGVDLPSLDVVVLDELPARGMDTLQRVGRVGRSIEHPGLAVLCLHNSPADLRIEANPGSLASAGTEPLPLPLHLDLLKLKSMLACHQEWAQRLKRNKVSRSDFQAALKKFYGEDLGHDEVTARLDELLSGLGEFDDGSWVYKGFRTSASQGKVDLVLQGTNRCVASIQDISVFRDAHPEGIYLGHTGERYRVVGYRGTFAIGEWSDPRSPIRLGKLMKNLKAIEVREERSQIATQGIWKDDLQFFSSCDPPPGASGPARGPWEFGLWDTFRKFDGYKEIDLRSSRKSFKRVSLAEVAARFRAAIDAGEHFPFLHDFTYRTLGWRWKLPRILPDIEGRGRIAEALRVTLSAYFADAADCSKGDLFVSFAPVEGELRVLDSTPGGSGLSSTLLGIRSQSALEQAAVDVAVLAARDKLRDWLAGQTRDVVDADGKELADALQQMASAWRG